MSPHSERINLDDQGAVAAWGLVMLLAVCWGLTARLEAGTHKGSQQQRKLDALSRTQLWRQLGSAPCGLPRGAAYLQAPFGVQSNRCWPHLGSPSPIFNTYFLKILRQGLEFSRLVLNFQTSRLSFQSLQDSMPVIPDTAHNEQIYEIHIPSLNF